MSSKKECCRSLTDLEGSDYLRYPLPQTETVKHLESWLREAMILPFSYEASINSNGEFVSFGQKMVEINEHAVQVRKGQVGEDRVKAEMEGVIKVEELLNSAQVGDLLFLFSPPGLSEEGFGKQDQRRLSFTYIFEVGEGQNGDKKCVRAIAIPAPEISPHTQIKQFTDVFGDNQAVSFPMESTEHIDRKLVATPILITKLSKESREKKLGQYTKSYIGKEWSELEDIIDRGLKLQNDELAESRRKSLIESISWQIRRYVDSQDGLRLNNIGEAARVVLAREASGHYLEMTSEELLDEYSKTENSMWVQLQYQNADVEEKIGLVREYGTEIAASERHIRYVREALLADPNASSILEGSACGGGGFGDVLNGIGIGKFGEIVLGRGHLIEKQLEALNENVNSISESMKCVKCPFCSEMVDAIVTSEKIECPKCHNSASRG